MAVFSRRHLLTADGRGRMDGRTSERTKSSKTTTARRDTFSGGVVIYWTQSGANIATNELPQIDLMHTYGSSWSIKSLPSSPVGFNRMHARFVLQSRRHLSVTHPSLAYTNARHKHSSSDRYPPCSRARHCLVWHHRTVVHASLAKDHLVISPLLLSFVPSLLPHLFRPPKADGLLPIPFFHLVGRTAIKRSAFVVLLVILRSAFLSLDPLADNISWKCTFALSPARPLVPPALD